MIATRGTGRTIVIPIMQRKEYSDRRKTDDPGLVRAGKIQSTKEKGHISQKF